MEQFLISSKSFGKMLNENKVESVNEIKIQDNTIILHCDDQELTFPVTPKITGMNSEWIIQSGVRWDWIKKACLQLSDRPVVMIADNDSFKIILNF